jgi:hypothetical protein
MSNIITNTLEELRAQIGELAPTIDKKPYSHNVVGICLRQVAKNFGPDEAAKAIRDYDLKSKGWA